MPSGSAYQALILPAPKRSVPAAQGGHGPPILIPHGPSTTYHPGAISSSFAPAQAPSHGSYSSAGVPPAPAAAGGGGNMSAISQAVPAAQSPAQKAAQAVQRVQAVEKFAGLMNVAPKLWQTGTLSTKDINPLGKGGWNNLSVDMGVDANAPTGAPILAPNDSKVTNIQQNWYSGQPLLAMQFTKGPNKGKYWYVAERIAGPNSSSLSNGDGLPSPGTIIKQGQPVARYATSGTGIEIGWAADPQGTTLSAADNTVNTAAGNEHRPGGTPEGQSFLHGMILGGGKPGSVVAGAAPRVARGSAQFVSSITGKPLPQQGQPVKPARPISSPQGLTVKGAPVTPAQIATANTILNEAHKLGVSKQAATAAIYTAIYESGLTTGDPANSLGYGGALAGSTSHFNVNDTVGQTKALLLGDSAGGYQNGGVAAQLAAGASIPQAAVKTEVPSIWPNNSYAGESGYGSDARAIAEAQAFVDRFGGFGGGNPTPIGGGSSGGVPASSSGGAVAPSGGAGVAPAASGGGGALPTGPDTTGAQTAQALGLAPTSSGPTAQQQAQQQLLSSFLSQKSPWDVGPKAAGFGGGGLGGALPPVSQLPDLALQSLQSLAGGIKLTNPRKKNGVL